MRSYRRSPKPKGGSGSHGRQTAVVCPQVFVHGLCPVVASSVTGVKYYHNVLEVRLASHLATYCLPEPTDFARTRATSQFDHVLAATFGLWSHVIPQRRLFTV